VESEGSRILGSGNRTEGGGDVEGEGERGPKLTNTKKCKRDIKISRTCQLLQAVH